MASVEHSRSMSVMIASAPLNPAVPLLGKAR